MKPRSDLDYIIVLGAHVNGTKLTLALLERVRRALLYLEENPGTKAVLSGGRGDGEQISEAEAMYRYLTEHGIAPERLIKEERSTNTKENLDFSLRLIGSTELQHWRRDKQLSCISWSCDRKEMWMSEKSIRFRRNIVPGDCLFMSQGKSLQF